ncbi:MAG TPA: FAD-binding oxidoreductase, partial [Candidatus Desulfobacillus sp.]|nr:FAD-binding oxidoreductase [Candidatus Desulfobacillus sp.]
MEKNPLEALAAILPADGLLAGADLPERHLRDWMEAAPPGTPLALARPRSTDEVSALLRACNELRLPVVPQGGLTGLAGGAVPVPGCVLLSLERMSGIEEIDTAAGTATVLAGTTLEALQQAAWDAGLFFPLDLGARGSCTLGGNLATNAGGNRVLRYGMARDLVLGLEVVLADGSVLGGLNKMLKNNTGYDLKQLFVGSEGTLGVITRAVLRLHPQPRSTCTALCAVSGYEAVLALLRHARGGLGGALSAFEMMWPDFYDLVTRRVAGLDAPLPRGHGAYVLVEAMGSDPARDQAHFEQVLGEALEAGIIADAVITQSEAEARALWRVRDASGELRRVFWPNTGFDVSIAAGQIGAFIEDCGGRLRRRWPAAETVFFGHVGDANIHIAVRIGEGEQPTGEIDDLVYGCVGDWRGSISAEHGIG